MVLAMMLIVTASGERETRDLFLNIVFGGVLLSTAEANEFDLVVNYNDNISSAGSSVVYKTATGETTTGETTASSTSRRSLPPTEPLQQGGCVVRVVVLAAAQCQAAGEGAADGPADDYHRDHQ